VTRDEHLSACEKCGSTNVRQDEDVLDTWFSSGLWPFATQGWPEKTPALEKFYPASDLETGYDILFFWVARMMMMGIHFMGEPPFKRVLLHGLVVDETGDKMSKVKGNVIDPLDLVFGASFDEVVQKALPGAPIEDALKKFKKAYPSVAQMGTGFPAYGTDALRITLASYSPQAKRIPLSPKKIDGYRHFCNKIWNATRFALPYIEEAKVGNEPPKATLLLTRWILSRLAATADAVKKGIDEFRLDDSTQALYRFVWNEVCDWYLELSKPIFADKGSAAEVETRDVLAHVLEATMRLLHPIIPFITEEIWQKLPRPEGHTESIVTAPFPTNASGRFDADAERDMAAVQAVIGAIRSIRTEHGVPWAHEMPVVLRTDDPARRELLAREASSVKALTKTAGLPLIEPRGGARPKGSVMASESDVEVLVSLIGLVDGTKEAERVEREIKSTEKDILAIEKKLSLPSFADKAPKEVVEESKLQLEAMKRKRAALEDARGIAGELGAKKTDSGET
jgi:valyl-tRNA synthetase